MSQHGFFDFEKRLATLAKSGDPLVALKKHIDFEAFRPLLAEALAFKGDKIKGGWPPHDPVLMFKVLILQSLYNLSDDQAEFQIRDRLSFMRFLGLELWQTVPDWLYRERLKDHMTELFRLFNERLKDRGYLAMGGRKGGGEGGKVCCGDLGKSLEGKPERRRRPLARQAKQARESGTPAPCHPRVRLQKSYLSRPNTRIYQGI